MSLLALLAASSSAPSAPPSIHSTGPVALDWANAQILIVASDMGITALREQSDVIYDPAADPSRRWAVYASGNALWVAHSADGITWGTPVRCKADGGPNMPGEDLTITHTWGPNPVPYRDGDGRLHAFIENGTSGEIDAFSSLDGINWTLTKASAIDRTGAWDADLVGSPNAVHDGTKFIVGYEGIRLSPRDETFSVAWGATPATLVKSPANPLVIPREAAGLGNSIVVDAMWVTPDGARAIITAHDGIGGTFPQTMWRMTTTKTDPTSWVKGDFALLGMVDPDVRNDLTVDHHGGRFVTAPDDDSVLVAVPVLPA